MSNALCRLSTESIMYVLLDVAPTPEIRIKKEIQICTYTELGSNSLFAKL